MNLSLSSISDPATLLLMASLGAAFLVTSMMVSTRSAFAMSLVLYTLPLTHFAGDGARANALRAAAVVIALLRLVGPARRYLPSAHASLRQWWPLVLSGLVLAVASLAWTQSRGATAESIVGLLFATALLWAFPTDDRARVTILRFVLLLYVGASVLLMPSGASWRAGRWRGVFANANTLGLFVAVGGLVLLFSARRKSSYVAVAAGVTGLLVLTGSRSSMLAFALGAIVLGLARPTTAGGRARLPWMAIVASVVLTGAILLAPVDNLPWRTKDTRADVWSTTTAAASENYLVGVGAGALDTEAGSSALRLFAELGTLGVVVFAWAYAHGFRRTSRYGTPAVALLILFTAHMLFEGWLLAGGSAIFVMFVLTTTTHWPRPASSSDTEVVVGSMPAI